MSHPSLQLEFGRLYKFLPFFAKFWPVSGFFCGRLYKFWLFRAFSGRFLAFWKKGRISGRSQKFWPEWKHWFRKIRKSQFFGKNWVRKRTDLNDFWSDFCGSKLWRSETEALYRSKYYYLGQLIFSGTMKNGRLLRPQFPTESPTQLWSERGIIRKLHALHSLYDNYCVITPCVGFSAVTFIIVVI